MKLNNKLDLNGVINYIISLTEKQIIKYGITGVIFSITTPLLFVLFSSLFPRVLVISILSPFSYIIKFFVYKLWVYKSKKVTPVRYIIHITPLYLISILFTAFTLEVNRTDLIAIGLIILNGGFGYMWGKFLYSLRNISISN